MMKKERARRRRTELQQQQLPADAAAAERPRSSSSSSSHTCCAARDSRAAAAAAAASARFRKVLYARTCSFYRVIEVPLPPHPTPLRGLARPSTDVGPRRLGRVIAARGSFNRGFWDAELQQQLLDQY